MQRFQNPAMTRVKFYTACFTALSFTFTSIVFPSALHAAPEVSAKSANIQDFSALKIPEALAKVETVFDGDEKAGRSVIVIQDAHSIPDAQRSIRKTILFLEKNYGARLIGVEGASGDLDTRIFQSYPDQEGLQKVFKDYMDKGEMTGSVAAAIFGLKKEMAARGVEFFGIEDWPVYEEGLALYLAAMGEEEKITKKLEVRSSKLEEEKKKAYSPELLQVDQAEIGFEKNSKDLLAYLKILAAIKTPEAGSEIALLLNEADKGQANDAEMDAEVRKLAAKLKTNIGRLSSEGQKTFSEKFQAFQTSQISAAQFALALKDLSEKEGFKLPMSQGMAHQAFNQRRMRDLEGTKLFKDIEAYTKGIKESLFRNDIERQLDQRTHELILLTKWAKLELSREDWAEVKSEIASSASGLLAMTRNVKFRVADSPIAQADGAMTKQDAIEKIPSMPGLTATAAIDSLSLRSAVGAEAISDLRPLFKYHQAFYENAEKRDAAFIKNLEKRLKPGQTAVMVAGGFHAQGLAEHLQAKGIDYALVMPNIAKLPEVSAYREHMKGNVDWKSYFEVKNGKINLYEAFVRYTRDRLLGTSRESSVVSREEKQNPRPTPQDPRLLKNWRDQIIRNLADEGKLSKAGEYTRFIDETLTDKKKKDLEARMQDVEKFITGLKDLDAKGQFTAPNIGKLLRLAQSSGASSNKAATILPSVNLNAAFANDALPRAAMSEVRTTPGVAKSEVRVVTIKFKAELERPDLILTSDATIEYRAEDRLYLINGEQISQNDVANIVINSSEESIARPTVGENAQQPVTSFDVSAFMREPTPTEDALLKAAVSDFPPGSLVNPSDSGAFTYLDGGDGRLIFDSSKEVVTYQPNEGNAFLQLARADILAVNFIPGKDSARDRVEVVVKPGALSTAGELLVSTERFDLIILQAAPTAKSEVRVEFKESLRGKDLKFEDLALAKGFEGVFPQAMTHDDKKKLDQQRVFERFVVRTDGDAARIVLQRIQNHPELGLVALSREELESAIANSNVELNMPEYATVADGKGVLIKDGQPQIRRTDGVPVIQRAKVSILDNVPQIIASNADRVEDEGQFIGQVVDGIQNPNLRFSFAGLVKWIVVGQDEAGQPVEKYVLVVNKGALKKDAKNIKLGPLGGAIGGLAEETLAMLERELGIDRKYFEAVDKELETKRKAGDTRAEDVIRTEAAAELAAKGQMDLRLTLKAETAEALKPKAQGLLAWFFKREGREINPLRELIEELAEEQGFLTSEEAADILAPRSEVRSAVDNGKDWLGLLQMAAIRVKSGWVKDGMPQVELVRTGQQAVLSDGEALKAIAEDFNVGVLQGLVGRDVQSAAELAVAVRTAAGSLNRAVAKFDRIRGKTNPALNREKLVEVIRALGFVAEYLEETDSAKKAAAETKAEAAVFIVSGYTSLRAMFDAITQRSVPDFFKLDLKRSDFFGDSFNFKQLDTARFFQPKAAVAGLGKVEFKIPDFKFELPDLGAFKNVLIQDTQGALNDLLEKLRADFKGQKKISTAQMVEWLQRAENQELLKGLPLMAGFVLKSIITYQETTAKVFGTTGRDQDGLRPFKQDVSDDELRQTAVSLKFISGIFSMASELKGANGVSINFGADASGLLNRSKAYAKKIEARLGEPLLNLQPAVELKRLVPGAVAPVVIRSEVRVYDAIANAKDSAARAVKDLRGTRVTVLAGILSEKINELNQDSQNTEAREWIASFESAINELLFSVYSIQTLEPFKGAIRTKAGESYELLGVTVADIKGDRTEPANINNLNAVVLKLADHIALVYGLETSAIPAPYDAIANAKDSADRAVKDLRGTRVTVLAGILSEKINELNQDPKNTEAREWIASFESAINEFLFSLYGIQTLEPFKGAIRAKAGESYELLGVKIAEIKGDRTEPVSNDNLNAAVLKLADHIEQVYNVLARSEVRATENATEKFNKDRQTYTTAGVNGLNKVTYADNNYPWKNKRQKVEGLPFADVVRVRLPQEGGFVFGANQYDKNEIEFLALFQNIFFEAIPYMMEIGGLKQKAEAAKKVDGADAAAIDQKLAADIEAVYKRAEADGFTRNLLWPGSLTRKVTFLVGSEAEKQRLKEFIVLIFTTPDAAALIEMGVPEILAKEFDTGDNRYRSFPHLFGLDKLDSEKTRQMLDIQVLTPDQSVTVTKGDNSVTFSVSGDVITMQEGENEFQIEAKPEDYQHDRFKVQWAEQGLAEIRESLEPEKGFTRTVLGRADGVPFHTQDTTNLLLANKGSAMLIDPSIPSLDNLKNAGLLDKVKYIYISHLHNDHTAGFIDLFLSGEFQKRGIKLVAAGPVYELLSRVLQIKTGLPLEEVKANLNRVPTESKGAEGDFIENVRLDDLEMNLALRRTFGHTVTYGLRATVDDKTSGTYAYLVDSQMPTEKYEHYDKFMKFFVDGVDFFDGETGLPGVHVDSKDYKNIDRFKTLRDLGQLFTVHAGGEQALDDLIRAPILQPRAILKAEDKKAQIAEVIAILEQSGRIFAARLPRDPEGRERSLAELLAPLVDVVTLQEGEELLSEGDAISAKPYAYAILDGGFELSKETVSFLPDVSNVRPGTLIGEMAFLRKGQPSDELDRAVADLAQQYGRTPQQITAILGTQLESAPNSQILSYTEIISGVSYHIWNVQTTPELIKSTFLGQDRDILLALFQKSSQLPRNATVTAKQDGVRAARLPIAELGKLLVRVQALSPELLNKFYQTIGIKSGEVFLTKPQEEAKYVRTRAPEEEVNERLRVGIQTFGGLGLKHEGETRQFTSAEDLATAIDEMDLTAIGISPDGIFPIPGDSVVVGVSEQNLELYDIRANGGTDARLSTLEILNRLRITPSADSAYEIYRGSYPLYGEEGRLALLVPVSPAAADQRSEVRQALKEVEGLSKTEQVELESASQSRLDELKALANARLAVIYRADEYFADVKGVKTERDARMIKLVKDQALEAKTVVDVNAVLFQVVESEIGILLGLTSAGLVQKWTIMGSEVSVNNESYRYTSPVTGQQVTLYPSSNQRDPRNKASNQSLLDDMRKFRAEAKTLRALVLGTQVFYETGPGRNALKGRQLREAVKNSSDLRQLEAYKLLVDARADAIGEARIVSPGNKELKDEIMEAKSPDVIRNISVRSAIEAIKDLLGEGNIVWGDETAGYTWSYRSPQGTNVQVYGSLPKNVEREEIFKDLSAFREQQQRAVAGLRSQLQISLREGITPLSKTEQAELEKASLSRLGELKVLAGARLAVIYQAQEYFADGKGVQTERDARMIKLVKDQALEAKTVADVNAVLFQVVESEIGILLGLTSAGLLVEEWGLLGGEVSVSQKNLASDGYYSYTSPVTGQTVTLYPSSRDSDKNTESNQNLLQDMRRFRTKLDQLRPQILGKKVYDEESVGTSALQAFEKKKIEMSSDLRELEIYNRLAEARQNAVTGEVRSNDVLKNEIMSAKSPEAINQILINTRSEVRSATVAAAEDAVKIIVSGQGNVAEVSVRIEAVGKQSLNALLDALKKSASDELEKAQAPVQTSGEDVFDLAMANEAILKLNPLLEAIRKENPGILSVIFNVPGEEKAFSDAIAKGDLAAVLSKVYASSVSLKAIEADSVVLAPANNLTVFKGSSADDNRAGMPVIGSGTVANPALFVSRSSVESFEGKPLEQMVDFYARTLFGLFVSTQITGAEELKVEAKRAGVASKLGDYLAASDISQLVASGLFTLDKNGDLVTNSNLLFATIIAEFKARSEVRKAA